MKRLCNNGKHDPVPYVLEYVKGIKQTKFNSLNIKCIVEMDID